MTVDSPGKKLRAAIEQDTVVTPGVFNPLVARAAEQAGFSALYLSGAAFSAAQLALPDIGLFTLTELAQQTAWITRRVSIPLIVDADTGFGEPVNVERTVIELEAAGAAAIQLEDQRLPKRCGHLSGKSLVPVDEMCAKVRAAVASRRDPTLVIIARTDARGVAGFDDAVARANRYVEAGADWIFPEALATRDEFAAFRRAMSAPLVANMTEFGQGPLLARDELNSLGYAVMLCPVSLLRLAMKTIETGLAELRERGTQSGMIESMQTRQQLYDLLGYTGYEARDRDYFGQSE